MLPTIELALSARRANPPEINTGRNGGLVVVLHLLSDTLGKRDGKAEPAWLRATLFGALAEKARDFHKGDLIFARGVPTLDRWRDRTGAEKSGLSMIASEPVPLGSTMQPPRPEIRWICE